MQSLSLSISGSTPVLMNNAASLARGNAGLGMKKIPTPEDEAASKAFKDVTTGQLYLPSENFRMGILKSACKGRRIGKRSATSVVAGALFVLEERCPLYDPATGEIITEYAIDVRRAVVQHQAVMRARPRIEHWGCMVKYEFDEDFLTAELILELQSIAGKISGVGDWRPSLGGPMGRYTVEKDTGLERNEAGRRALEGTALETKGKVSHSALAASR